MTARKNVRQKQQSSTSEHDAVRSAVITSALQNAADAHTTRMKTEEIVEFNSKRVLESPKTQPSTA